MISLNSKAALGGIVLLCLSVPALANSGVLVFGGTGQLGMEVVQDLLEANEDVTVFARPTSKTEKLEDMGVAIVRGDVLRQDDVTAALNTGPYRVVVDALARDGGVDSAFYIDSMKHIAAAAKETGVKQVILHGSVGAGLSHLSDRNSENEFGDLMMSKSLGELFLMESGVPYTIIRNWAIVPNGTQESGKAFMSTDQSLRGLISRDALARFTMECLDTPVCMNEIFHTADDEIDTIPRYLENLREQRAWEAQQVSN